ncbi:hypothetical protein OH76DRAFT_1491119 [Lentinus brumalis]|uniref:Uncharacterized protein n=1 Tax=Lentinus brumalis TaxID=2498619 RepID=A0A371CGQ5_9APHY|nr:hypothetical protein OH76DRAFT_1491119 [Polyporus brumalis]
MPANTGARRRAAAKMRASKRVKGAKKDNADDPIVIGSSDSGSDSNSDSDTEQEAKAPKKKKRKTTVQTEEEEDAKRAREGIDVEEPEDAEADLDRLQRTWTAPIYAFFSPDVIIGHDENGRRYHNFKCAAKACKGKKHEVRRYLDTADAKSTSNLRKHTKKCWGEAAIETEA